MTRTADPMPTSAFPEAERAVLQAHQEYRNHVGLVPETTPDLPDQPKPADTPHEPLRREEPTLEEVPSELGDPVQESNRLLAQKRLWITLGWLVLALLASIGAGIYFAGYVQRQIDVSLPAWPFMLVVAALLVLTARGVARAQQRLIEASGSALRIPALHHVATCYVQRLWDEPHVEGLSEERKAELERIMARWAEVRRGGKDVSHLQRDRILAWLGLGLLLAITYALNLLKQGFDTPEQIVGGLLVSAIPAVGLVFLIFGGAESSLDVPPVPELAQWNHEYQAKRRQVIQGNQKRMQESQERYLSQSRQQQQKSRQDMQRPKLGEMRNQAAHEAKRQELLAKLKTAAALYERERGFRREELVAIARRLKEANNQKRWLYPLSGLSLFMATYFASISLSSLLQHSLIIVVGIRLAPVWWPACVLFMLLAEWLLTRGLTGIRRAEYAYRVLQSGYHEADRIKGLTYVVADQADVGLVTRGQLPLMIVGAGIILLELGLNIYYMVHFSQGSAIEAFILPLLFSCAFVGLSFMLVDTHSHRQVLEEAMDRDWRPHGASHTQPTTYVERTVQAHQEKSRWQQASSFEDPLA